ncbi:MAG: DUF1566 domain-containing protein [Planctomycetota bacterium]|nr:DUF1566 domain-containing protein [Planctomycetota bacterium]
MRMLVGCLLIFAGLFPLRAEERSYPIVDTGQVRCYDDRTEIAFPAAGARFFGQDAHYEGHVPAYKENGDGSVSDLVTGLTWQKDPGKKQTLKQALAGAKACRLGGQKDWRVPTIKELYSLILFTGTDPDPMSRNAKGLVPFIDTRYFVFQYGREDKGERIIDSQYGSSTKYVSTTMRGDATLFGVNFADGRIKGYGLIHPRTRKEKTFYFIYVRGNPAYGKNKFRDNKDGTITDSATGLIWMQADSGSVKGGPKGDGRMNWEEGLAWAEGLTHAGHSDWRMPNIKELQSLVDYTRSPKTTKSAALDPLFKPTKLTDEGGKPNYPFYWASSSHNSLHSANAADYIAFGEALGWMQDRRSGSRKLLDVHGAGSQRSDPKAGDPKRFPFGRGPQGDVIRIYNYVLCVRGGKATPKTSGPAIAMKPGKGPPQQGGAGKNKFVGRLDKNGDGKISRDEFDGPKRAFGRLDKNGDGFISGEEAPSGPPRRR